MSGLVSSPMITTEILVAGQWLIKQKIGSGSFGEIYEAYDIHTNQRVAVKIESCDSKYPQLVEEHKVYISIHGHAKPSNGTITNNYHSSSKHTYGGRHHHTTDGGMEPSIMPGFPKIYWFGSIESGKFHALVMELLGDSLETLYNRCNRKFTLKTVLQLSFQLIDRIEQQHKCGWLHRDIKPDNFLMGGTGETASTLFVIDMGLCKQFKDPVTGEHIQYKDNKKLIGTPRYASLNTHLGIEQCRRDDLESIGYMLLYLLIGKLPWQGLKAKNKQEKYERISAKKSSVSVESLCKGCPPEFVKYLHYARQLKFTDKPDYRQLKKMFRDLYHKKGFKDDQQYDWMTPSTAQQPTQLSQQSIAVTKPLQLAMQQRNTSQQQQQQQHSAAFLQQQQSQQATVANLYVPNVSPTGNEDKENGARQQSTTAQAPEHEVRRQQQQQRPITAYHTPSGYQPQYASTAMLPPQHPTNAAGYPQQQQAYNAAAAIYARHSASSPFLQTGTLHSPAVSSALDVVGHSSNSPSPVQANYQTGHFHPNNAMLPVGSIPVDLAQYNSQLYATPAIVSSAQPFNQQQLNVPAHSRQSTHASTTNNCAGNHQYGKPVTAQQQQRQTSTQPQPPSPSAAHGDQLTHLSELLQHADRSKEHYKNMCNKYDVMLTRAEQEMRRMLDHIAMHSTTPFSLDYPLAGGYQPPANAQPQHAQHHHHMRLRSTTQRQTSTTQPPTGVPAKASQQQPVSKAPEVTQQQQQQQQQRVVANEKPQSVKRKLDISAAESDYMRSSGEHGNASKRPAFSATQPATYFLDTNIAQQASNLLHSFQHAEPYSSNSDGSRPSFGAAAAYETAGLPNSSNLRRAAQTNLIQTF